MSGAATKPVLSKSGLRKAAILLLNLEYQRSAELLRLVSDDHVEAIGQSIAELGEISPEETETVLSEFLLRSGRTDGLVRGGWNRARRLLTSAFGDDSGNRMSASIPIYPSKAEHPLSPIESSDPALLAELLAGESPQTVAVVLAHVSAECSSGVLQQLGEELRGDVALRMASLEGVSPKLLDRIAAILKRKLNAFGSEKTGLTAGPKIVADLLNRVSPQVAEQILTNMDAKDQEAAGQIRDLLFIFDDLQNVDANGIRELVKRIDRQTLTIALKGVGQELVDSICATMSKRGAEMLAEDMEALGPVKIRDVEAAQKEILLVAKAMESEGVLSLSASESDEYVQ